MILRHLRLTALGTALCALVTGNAWGHATPYGDTYTFSGENFPDNFGVVKEPETGEIFTYPTAPYTITFDGIEEIAGGMKVNEKAITWPGKSGIIAEQATGIDGQTLFELTDWQNSGEVLEFSFDTVDGQWISDNPQANSSFTLKGVDWQHAVEGDSPAFFRTGFYFYWTNNGVPLTGMSFTLPDLGVLVGPHPFDPSVSEVVYIAYGGGQVDDVTDEYVGGVDISGGTRQLDANASWALLQAVLSLPPASGNGFRLGYLVDIQTEIDATSGDFNGDGNVDTIDYDILRDNFRQAGGFTEGDINFDGSVDLADFVDFKSSYQLANGQPLQTVPEPGTLALAGIALGGALLVRRRRLSKQVIAGIAIVGSVFAGAQTASAQRDYDWINTSTSFQTWNNANNWFNAVEGNFVPSQPLGGAERTVINNGGAAFVDSNGGLGTDAVAGLILGRDPNTSGSVEIRTGGSLSVVQDFEQFGVAQIGENGTGSLSVLTGGNFSAHSLNVAGVNSQISAAGNASIAVTTAASLTKTTTITGPSVNFTAASLTLGGTLVADITSGSHSPIVVSGAAKLVLPTLKVQMTGHTPAFGDEFALIDATSLSGKFAAVDTSTAPLDSGLAYRVSYNAADATVNLKVDNTLVLKVDPSTGAASIDNVIGGAISFDGYSILSDNGLLTGAFTGLNASDADWLDAGLSANSLSELNLTGATFVGLGASLSIGSVFSAPVAENLRDLVFEFTSNGEIRQGIVEYGDIVTPGQVGDTDGDGDVDLTDLNNVRNNFGGAGQIGSTPGDAFPFDGQVNLTDLNGVRNNFGATAGSVASVPEPATWAMAAMGAVALLGVARKRK